MEIETKIRQLGNSLGIVTAIPKEFIDEKNISVNQKVIVDILVKKPIFVEDLFGFLKDWSKKTGKTTKQIKDELKEGWDDDL